MPKMVWIWQGALHACFFLGFFVFWRSRACACGGARWWWGGETDLATRGARLRTQGVSCAHVFVSVCVRTRQLLCVVCLFAPRASRLLGRIVLAVARAAWLACVCVPLFLVLC